MVSQNIYLILLKKYCSNYSGLSIHVWQGIFINFIESTFVGICFFLSLYFVNEFHLSVESAGMIMASYGLGTVLGGIIGGKLSDILSPRIVSITSLCLQAIAYFILTKTQTRFFLMLNLFMMGIGTYGFITSNYVWTLAHCDHSDRLKTINILDVVSNLGLAVSGIIIGLISTHNFIHVFQISTLFLCITAIYLILENNTQQNKIINKNKILKNYSISANSNLIYFVLFCLFLSGIIISQMSSTYSIYLQSIFPKMGNKSFSILFTLNAILVVIFQAPVANFFGDYNKIILISFGGFLLGFGMLLLNFAYAYWIAILSCLFITTGEILFFSFAQLLCYENGPEEKKGESLGWYRTIFAASRIFGPLVGGIIYQQFSCHTLWLVCFLLGLLCFIPNYLFRLI